MSRDALKCPVCNGTMNAVKVLPVKFGRLVRFRCTCGHCEDFKEDRSIGETDSDALVLEGLQELP